MSAWSGVGGATPSSAAAALTADGQDDADADLPDKLDTVREAYRDNLPAKTADRLDSISWPRRVCPWFSDEAFVGAGTTHRLADAFRLVCPPTAKIFLPSTTAAKSMRRLDINGNSGVHVRKLGSKTSLLARAEPPSQVPPIA